MVVDWHFPAVGLFEILLDGPFAVGGMLDAVEEADVEALEGSVPAAGLLEVADAHFVADIAYFVAVAHFVAVSIGTEDVASFVAGLNSFGSDVLAVEVAHWF